MKERREYTRYDTDLKVRYIYRRGMIALEEDTYLKNLSLNGMRLYLSSVIKNGDVFLVEMRLPLAGTISAIAEVIWIKEEGVKTIEAGAAFDWVSDINRLAEYLQRLQSQAA